MAVYPRSPYLLPIKVIVAFAIAVLVYVLMNPAIIIYSTIMSSVIICTSGWACPVITAFMTIILPILALFFAVFGIFEVFIK